jgi:cytochrome c553
MPYTRSVLLILLLCSAPLGIAATARGGEPSQDAIAFFEAKIRPILVERCASCHGEKKQFNGLRLDTRDAAFKGGDLGPGVVPGKPEESLILQAIRHEGDLGLTMPPDQPKLSDAVIADMTEWVRMGAPWPDAPPSGPGTKPADADPKHWSYQPIRKPTPPSNGAPTVIDAFLKARRESAGVTTAPPAEKSAWLRRVTFDLTGLPPTPEEIASFEADSAPDAEAKVVDRLLASPRYGERWGRHWLDVARYADTKGYVFVEERRYPFSYTYRDWVISALNEDMPYDQFVMRQIAADRLPLSSPDDVRHLAAMGFLTVGRRFLNDQNDIIDDRIDVVSRGLMGITVACARCHDHKYDPIPTQDYYSFYGIFSSSTEPAELPEIYPGKETPESKGFQERVEKERGKIAAYQEQVRGEKEKELREKAGAYLLAAFDLEFNPRDGKDGKMDGLARERKLKQEVIRWATPKWKALLADEKSPLSAAWRAYEKSSEWESERSSEAAKAGDARIAAAFAAKPIHSPREVAERYAEVFGANDPEAVRVRDAFFGAGGPLAIKADDAPLNRAEREKVAELKRNVDGLFVTDPHAPQRAMVMVDKPDAHDETIFIRGNPGRRGEAAPRRFLKAISGPERPLFNDGSGRLQLAKAVGSPENPLTPRVIVNRVWAWHFGSGLVTTPSDFGARGEPPTHPELLEWLAATFLEEGWSLKALHRKILLTEAYRQAADHPQPESCAAADPENQLLWRFPRQRLDFEAVRDAMLASAGRLDPAMGGRSVPLNSAPYSTRRAVYGFIDRQNLDGEFRSFDFASPDASAPKRPYTTVPQQALYLMNSPFVLEQAKHMIASLPPEPEARIRAMYLRLYSRPPTPEELSLGLRFVEGPAPEAGKGDHPGPWERYAHALLMSNEFAFMD